MSNGVPEFELDLLFLIAISIKLNNFCLVNLTKLNFYTNFILRIVYNVSVMNNYQLDNVLAFPIELPHVYHEFHETCHSVTFIVLINSHQRWKQTQNRICFHLWCESTLVLLRCHSIIWSLFFMFCDFSDLSISDWIVSKSALLKSRSHNFFALFKRNYRLFLKNSPQRVSANEYLQCNITLDLSVMPM